MTEVLGHDPNLADPFYLIFFHFYLFKKNVEMSPFYNPDLKAFSSHQKEKRLGSPTREGAALTTWTYCELQKSPGRSETPLREG